MDLFGREIDYNYPAAFYMCPPFEFRVIVDN